MSATHVTFDNMMDINNTTSIRDTSRIDNIADITMGVFPPIIIFFGTVFNALAIAVLSRQTLTVNMDQLAAFLLIILSVTDMISLNMGAWIQWLKVLFRWLEVNNSMEAQSDLSCKVYNYLYCVMRTYTVWVLVVVTAERLVMTMMALNFCRSLTKRNVCILLVIIMIAIDIMYFPVLLTFGKITGFGMEVDDIIDGVIPSCGSHSLTVFWIDNLARIIVPFIIMLICNMIIIGTFYRAHSNRRSISNNRVFDHETRQLRMLTALLLIASFSHLVLTLPNIFYNIPYILHYFNYYTNEDLSAKADQQHLQWVIVTCLIYIDQSVNFLLYCMSGKLVRNEFYTMITCLMNCRKKSNTQLSQCESVHFTSPLGSVKLTRSASTRSLNGGGDKLVREYLLQRNGGSMTEMTDMYSRTSDSRRASDSNIVTDV